MIVVVPKNGLVQPEELKVPSVAAVAPYALLAPGLLTDPPNEKPEQLTLWSGSMIVSWIPGTLVVSGVRGSSKLPTRLMPGPPEGV
ncbi:hypothetical protein ABFU82_25915 [Nocardioides sp. WV_118_6]